MSAIEERRAVLAVFARHPRPTVGGYGREVRAAVVWYAKRLREAGATWARVGEGLPVSPTTIRAWLLSAETAPAAGALVPVAVFDTPRASPARVEPTQLTLVTPGGYRLEGLDLVTARELLGGLP